MPKSWSTQLEPPDFWKTMTAPSACMSAASCSRDSPGWQAPEVTTPFPSTELSGLVVSGPTRAMPTTAAMTTTAPATSRRSRHHVLRAAPAPPGPALASLRVLSVASTLWTPMKRSISRPMKMLVHQELSWPL